MADDIVQRLRRYAEILEVKVGIFKDKSAEENAQACAYRDSLNILRMHFPEVQEDNRRYFVLRGPEEVREIGIGGYSRGELIPVADPDNGKLFLYRVERVTELTGDRVVYHVREEDSFVQDDFDPSKTTVFIRISETGRRVAEDSTPSMTRVLGHKSGDDELPNISQEEIDKLLRDDGLLGDGQNS